MREGHAADVYAAALGADLERGRAVGGGRGGAGRAAGGGRQSRSSSAVGEELRELRPDGGGEKGGEQRAVHRGQRVVGEAAPLGPLQDHAGAAKPRQTRQASRDKPARQAATESAIRRTHPAPGRGARGAGRERDAACPISTG